jgi:hypothetical protein
MEKVLERNCFGNQVPKLTREKDRKIMVWSWPSHKKRMRLAIGRGNPPKKIFGIVGFPRFFLNITHCISTYVKLVSDQGKNAKE